MKIRVWGALSLALLWGCEDQKEAPKVHRAELHKLTGNTFELVPTAGQLPYCLVYTLATRGVVRQLTLNKQNRSVACEAGKPIGNVAYKAPLEEGPVRVLVLFSDQPLHAGSVAQQIYEVQARNPNFTAMDLRLPGKVFTEIQEFTPSTEAQVQVGSVVSSSGEVKDMDAGTPNGSDAGTR